MFVKYSAGAWSVLNKFELFFSNSIIGLCIETCVVPGMVLYQTLLKSGFWMLCGDKGSLENVTSIMTCFVSRHTPVQVLLLYGQPA